MDLLSPVIRVLIDPSESEFIELNVKESIESSFIPTPLQVKKLGPRLGPKVILNYTAEPVPPQGITHNNIFELFSRYRNAHQVGEVKDSMPPTSM